MRILIIGGEGTIGRRLVHSFQVKHEVITAGRNSGDHQVDLANATSISHLFESTRRLDAVICAAGEARWGPFSELSEEDYYIGIKSKLMGQVNMVRIGREYIIPGGSFTLTSGILADDPVLSTTSAAMVNGALHSFVKAASLEMPASQRINVVSCGLVEDAVEKYQDYFPGHNAIPMDRVVNAYVRSVLGKGNGEIIREY